MQRLSDKVQESGLKQICVAPQSVQSSLLKNDGNQKVPEV